MMGSPLALARMTPSMARLFKWFRTTMLQFGQRFSDPFLRRAFPLLEYSLTDAPFVIHLVKHAYGFNGAVAWPVGASAAFAKSVEKRYVDLGGEVHYRSGVEKILSEGGRAVGVRLEDGIEHRADIVISNADGRKTIMGMLEGRYVDDRIRRYCAEPDDETPWAVHVFLGVARDLSGEPSALVQLLEKPFTIANHTTDSLEMQIYGFDRTMAPEGKGVIKVELVSGYSYWKKLYADRERYDEEKGKVADAVIDILEATHFPGIKGQVEVVDVPTLMTWERYVGGTHGFMSMPSKKLNPMTMILGRLDSTLPGLSDFYLAGTWASSTGALFANALSGRKIIKRICERRRQEVRLSLNHKVEDHERHPRRAENLLETPAQPFLLHLEADALVQAHRRVVAQQHGELHHREAAGAPALDRGVEKRASETLPAIILEDRHVLDHEGVGKLIGRRFHEHGGPLAHLLEIFNPPAELHQRPPEQHGIVLFSGEGRQRGGHFSTDLDDQVVRVVEP
jgi:phytoene dehydrogenase-like protein